MTGHTCHFCGEPINPDHPGTWRRIQGWERKAQGATRRSGSDITLRQPVDDYAHPGCIAAEKTGVGALQTGFGL